MLQGHTFVYPTKFARIGGFVDWSSGRNCELYESQEHIMKINYNEMKEKGFLS